MNTRLTLILAAGIAVAAVGTTMMMTTTVEAKGLPEGSPMAIWLVTKHKETMTIPIRDLDTILTISVTMEYAAIMTNTLAILEQATKQIDHQENPVTTETKTQETLIAK